MNGRAYSDRSGLAVMYDYADYVRYSYPRPPRKTTVAEHVKDCVIDMLTDIARKQPSVWWNRYPYVVSVREGMTRGEWLYSWCRAEGPARFDVSACTG